MMIAQDSVALAEYTTRFLQKSESSGEQFQSTSANTPIGLYSWVHLRYGLLFCCVETHDPALPRRRFLMLPGRTDNSPDGTSTR